MDSFPLVPVPHALIVEDYRPHALAAAAYLRKAGFQVQTAPTLVKGVEVAEALLDKLPLAQPLLIVIDLHLPWPRTPADRFRDGSMTEGAALAAYLGPRIQARALLVASTSDPSSESQEEALLTGCRLVFLKPFQQYQAHLLRALLAAGCAGRAAAVLADTSPHYVQAASATLTKRAGGLWTSVQKTLQRAAAVIVRQATLTAAVAERWSWDESAVRHLLLNYHHLIERQPEARRWIEDRGGLEAVLERLQTRSSFLQLSREQQAMFNYMLEHPYAEDWEAMARHVNLGRTAFYKYRSRLFSVFALELNSWE